MSEHEQPFITFKNLVHLLKERDAGHREVIALAGPPAVGKSTASRQLETALNGLLPGSAAVLEMDGFHFDDRILIPRGLHPRKGAPETFDVAGLIHMLKRLRANTEPEVAVPVFDRDLEIARAGAGIIPRSVRHLIVEGNYLLLEREPWCTLTPLFDIRIGLVEDLDVLRQRLVARWKEQGLPQNEIDTKVDGNDMLNATLVLTESQTPDFYLGVDQA